MTPTALSRAAVVPAAGSGSRLGAGGNKLLELLAGEPILLHTLRVIAAVAFDQVVLVTQPDERPTMAALADRAGIAAAFADGGPTRQASVARGLQAVEPGIDLVAVHDAARPLAEPALFADALASAGEHGSGVVAVPVSDTLKRVADGRAVETVDRAGLWAMQTPQCFRRELLVEAFARAAVTGFEGTDEAGLVEAAGHPVYIVEGSRRNLKVTHPEDLALAEQLLRPRSPRIGYGFDVHRLAPGRVLWLGGVQVPHELGLLGHSDADALLHAICDAVLGALGAGDIGAHFPDTDPAYAGADSRELLRQCWRLAREAGYTLGNLDATVIAQRPRLAPHIASMREAIAAVMEVDSARVSVKATTHEELDDLGAGLGIAVHAVALLVPA